MWTLSKEKNGLVYRYDGEVLRIEPWGDNSFRVRSTILGELEDTDYALIPQAQKNADIQIEEYKGTIKNGKITAVMEVSDWTKKCYVSYYNDNGKLLLKEAEEGGALNKKSRSFRSILGGNFGLTVAFQPNKGEKLYGMGQYQQEILDVNNCVFELAHRNSQVSIPFVMSSLGYGFLWHNPAIGKVCFGKNIIEWNAENTNQMDYWITSGNSPDEIERSYAEVTGKVPMMPEYGMGFWQCKLRYWNQEQLINVAREYKKKNIPINVIVCDFFHWPKMGDFRFDEEFFPSPKAMVKELKDMGIELMVSIWPQIDLQSENFQEMKQKGFLVKTDKGVEIAMRFGGESTFYDATNPKARSYVWEKCKENYYEDGVKIFWLDEAEPEYTVYDFDNYRYYKGANIQIGNLYPKYYSQTFYEGMEKEGQKDIVNLVRCAWAGSQKYGALVWSGDIHSDWETLRKQICAGLSMGIVGIPWWTTDIGGFSGGNPDDDEFRKLLVRWFQWGTFCPVMRLHGDRQPTKYLKRKDGSSNLFTGGDNEIWSFGEENYEILKKYINFREAMRPYTRQCMEEAHLQGKPVMRTMFYEFPHDELCWDLNDQYMYGSDILVAPIVYEDTCERTVYLPKGATWTSIHDNKVYEGGQFINVGAPINIIPVFLKDGKQDYLIGLI